MHQVKMILALVLCWFLIALAPTASAEDSSAVVLLYHRFGEDSYPSTNIRLEQFENQIKLMQEGGYHFMALSDALTHLKEDRPFPTRTIVITIDDAYKSFQSEGWPRLKAAGIPATLFVSTDPVDEGHSNYMTWDDIRALKADGVEIGHHGAAHMHMVAAGLEAALEDVRRASSRFEAELGSVPPLFAYPYGEYDLQTLEAIKEEGFEAALAQYSGPIAPWQDRYSLPRFPVNERYGDEARFKLVSQTLALPIGDLIPSDPLLSDATNPPLLGFTVEAEIGSLKAMACYPSHLGKAADLNFIATRRVEVRFDKPFPKGRSRINCTMPAGGGRWYWFGQFYLLPGGPLD